MSFSTDRGIKRNQRYRHTSTVATTDERGAMLAAAKAMQCDVATVVSAAMLAFASLDRESQVALILSHGDRDSLRRLHPWTVWIPRDIYNLIHSWSFPLFRRPQVTRAACLGFLALSESERAEWIAEVFVFVGDPRVSKCVSV